MTERESYTVIQSDFWAAYEVFKKLLPSVTSADYYRYLGETPGVHAWTDCYHLSPRAHHRYQMLNGDNGSVIARMWWEIKDVEGET